MPDILGKPLEQVLDGENNAVEFDAAYTLRGDLVETLRQLRQRHGEDLLLLPMSATSSGGGIFQSPAKNAASVIGLRFEPPAEPRIRSGRVAELAAVRLDEIVIDRDRQQICAGAAVTLEQLNRALAQTLDHRYKVAGADLTSYQYAAAGATFMTGGMGPQRRYFSDSVIEAAIYNGSEIEAVEGEALRGYAGTYGWSGIVSALRCNFYPFPANEISFALPVSDSPQQLAGLLARLAPLCYLRLDPGGVQSGGSQSELILGLEHVSLAAMGPLLASSADSAAGKRAQALASQYRAAGADGVIFVNGLSQDSVDEFLQRLLDDPDADEFTIGGISLEQAEVFNDAEAMRELREAVPWAARMQTPRASLVYKNHSDANISISPSQVEPVMTCLWQINRDYVARVEDYFEQNPEVSGEILVYGHLNPYGVDPHNRVTLGCDQEDSYRQARAWVIEQRAVFYRDLAALCHDGAADLVGGEKSADSERAILGALGGEQNAPPALREKFTHQRETIRAAASLFNWRALEPYV